MATQPPSIAPVPTPPIQRGDRATFSSRVDAFIVWLTTAVSQFAAVSTNVYNNAAEAFQSALTATSSATTASSAAATASQTVNAAMWMSGRNYGIGEAAISTLNFQTYRRRVAGAGTIDPKDDPTNWALLVANGSFLPIVVPVNGINGISGGVEINLSRGNYFKRTQNGGNTLVFTNVPQDGFSFTYEVNLVAGLLQLPASVRTTDDLPYSFTPGKKHLLMFTTSDTGTTWLMSAATNYSAS